MNINVGIIDQQITGLLERHPEWLSDGDENKKKSEAFVLVCMANCLGISQEESAELLTDGGNDAGVDGMRIGDMEDDEFLVTLFQGKYKTKNLDGTSNFPENSVQKAVDTVRILFDPSRKVVLNEKIAPKIEEIRSLIRNGYIPQIRYVLCNNGTRWNDAAQGWIDDLTKECLDKVKFVHFNHNSIVQNLQRTKPVDTKLQLTGQVIVEDMNYMRVLVGRISVQHIADLFKQHGDRLLQQNIRRYLGLHNNRVNADINKTLNSSKSDKFYFYNNGITVVCDKFDYNAFQKADHIVQLKNMQIINGGQTCRTIYEAFQLRDSNTIGQSAYVMIRVYQLAEDSKEFIQDVTYATNSQNPVDLRDLRSNDEIQKRLEIGMKDLGYSYKRQREESAGSSNAITSSVAAEATLAIWREKPHQAKFRRKEHFGKLYGDIFNSLNAAQAILAVLIFREVENKRKRPLEKTPPEFLPYASHYLSMLVGRNLLKNQKISLPEVSHKNFTALTQMLQDNEQVYYANAIKEIKEALRQCYGDRRISLQQLSATFRSGDLLEML